MSQTLDHALVGMILSWSGHITTNNSLKDPINPGSLSVRHSHQQAPRPGLQGPEPVQALPSSLPARGLPQRESPGPPPRCLSVSLSVSLSPHSPSLSQSDCLCSCLSLHGLSVCELEAHGLSVCLSVCLGEMRVMVCLSGWEGESCSVCLSG